MDLDASLQAYQVGSYFEALDEDIHLARIPGTLNLYSTLSLFMCEVKQTDMVLETSDQLIDNSSVQAEDKTYTQVSGSLAFGLPGRVICRKSGQPLISNSLRHSEWRLNLTGFFL